MRNAIRITGWAPEGEPAPKGPGSAEFFLKLSEVPDAVWQRLFVKAADPLSALHRHDVVYELREGTLRVWCPVRMIAATVESAKRLVSSVNVAALDFDKQVDKLQVKQTEHHSRDWAGIEAEKGKIRFD